MKLQQIETLLLQEMEDVKGGFTAGVCECNSGAGQGYDSDGRCLCYKGGAGQLIADPNPTCMCGVAGGSGQ